MRFSFSTKLPLAGAVLMGARVLATDPTYINSGTVSDPAPQIDATTFVNEGVFDIHTSLPYDTSNTLNVTNKGTLNGAVGFRFDYVTNSGRKRSANFVNEGAIYASDPNSFFINFNGLFTFASYILVDSTNIVSPGLLSAGGNGLVKLQGNKIDLRTTPVLAASSTTQTGITSLDSTKSTNFVNESRFVDIYWGVGTNNALGNGTDLLSLPTQFNLPYPFSGVHEVLAPDTNFVSLPNFSNLSGFKAYAFTRPFSGTNNFVQVVFVSTNIDPSLNIDVRFSQNSPASRGAQALVQFSVPDLDPVTGQPFTNYLYFSDNSAFATSGGDTLAYQTNIGDSTSRPNAYDVTLLTPFNWANATTANVPYTPSLLWNPGYQDSEVSHAYAAYAVAIGNGNRRVSNIFGQTVTNLVYNDPTNSLGRIEITANELDLNSARLRAEGLISLKATNFVDLHEGAKLDSQQISLDLTSTNSTFIISNLLAGNVHRLSGQLSAWSAVWSNQRTTGENDKFHVLILDNSLIPTQPSTAYGFTLRATNQPNSQIILADPTTVARNFLIESEGFTVKSNLNLPGNIGYTNMPRVLNFTNEGAISIPGLAGFSRQNGPLASFVNGGTITSLGESISSQFFANSGLLSTFSGPITVSNVGGIAYITNGAVKAATHFTIATDQLILSNSTITAGSVSNNNLGNAVYTPGTITLNVGSVLANLDATNSWQSINGFQLFKSNPGDWQGDLLGTKITSVSRPFFVTPHIWTANDYGASSSGYSNNAAVGWLTLDGTTTGKFKFSAPNSGIQSAIYVDYLELTNNATNYNTAIEIDPNFTVYFADSSLPPSKLDGTHNGRLRWVQSYAGANSSTNVTLQDGRIILVNKALVQSTDIDSDADGTPNSFDDHPFDGPVVQTTIVDLSPLKTRLLWNGAANTTYTVDYTTNLVSWQVLTTITTGSSAGLVTIDDPVSPEGPCFYRVRYTP